MRLLLVCRSMPWHMAGGMENHAWDLARALAACGDEVHLLTTQAHAQRPAPADPPGGIAIHECAAAAPGRYSPGVFTALARQAMALDQAHHFDAIHAQGFAANAFARALAPRLAITVHGTLTSETVLYPAEFARLSLPRKAAALWRHKGRLASAPLFRRALRMARVVLVDSEFTRGELAGSQAELEPKLRLVALGIHPERIPAPADPPEPPPPLRLLSVGRLTRAKGMHVALKALGQMRGADWRWTVAGTGPELEPLRRQARKLALDGRVEFPGEVDDEDLAALRRQSHLFLYPELGCPAFGLVALEAMLAGLPVLGTDRGAIPEVLGEDGGWLAPADDPDALAQRLQGLLDAPRAIEDVARRCRQSALERFSFERMVQGTRRALGECAGGGRDNA